METLFWIWLAIAGAFLIVELMTPTMIFICFVVGAVAAAIIAQVWPDAYYWQTASFAVLSTGLIPFTRRFAKKISKPAPELSNIDRMIDQTALVIEPIDPDLGGKVKFEGEVWIAKANVAVEANTKVKIIAVSGTKVIVEPLD
ncbi:MAG: NfeD family protein [candidate division Zixibacteria bacterium]|nr:NfeD family protein [candidate division Zixibacteria bacterium]